ncbi:hypothetical protein AVEN_168077-2-1, partial [Araneus ventricosus]
PYGQVPPRITHTVSRITVQSGDTVQLPCAGQAFPLPTYRWYRKDGPLSASPLRLGHRREMAGGTLVLRNAEARDSGRYVCVLASSGSEDRAETELVVTGNSDKRPCFSCSGMVDGWFASQIMVWMLNYRSEIQRYKKFTNSY